MPTQRKKTTKRKSPARPRKAAAGRPSINKKKTGAPISDEVYILIALAVDLMLFLSNFHLLGAVGEFFRGVMFGLFGITAYVFPVFMGAAIVLWFLYADRDGFYTRLFQALAIYLAASVIAHLPVLSEQKNSGLNPYMFCKENSKGGGVLAGYLAGGMYDAMGVVGAWIVTILLVIILIMAITGGSLFDLIESGGVFLENQAIKNEKRNLEREEKRLERAERNRQAREQNRLERELLETQKQEQSRRIKESELSDFNQPLTGAPDTDREEITDYEEEEILSDHGEVVDDEPFDDEEGFLDEDDPDEPVDEPEDPDIEEEFEEEPSEEPEEVGSEAMQTPREIPFHEFTVEELAPFEFDFDSFEFTAMPAAAALPAENARSTVKKTAVETAATYAGRDGDEGTYEPDEDDSAYASYPAEEEGDEEAYSPVDSGGESGEEEYPEDTPQQIPEAEEQQRPSGGLMARVGAGVVFAQDRDVNRENSSGKTFGGKPVAEKKEEKKPAIKKNWVLPSLKNGFLIKPVGGNESDPGEELEETKEALRDALDSFGIKVEMKGASRGPSVTRYEILPQRGVKVSRITNLADDLMLALAARGIRIEAPIPGKSAVGIEVPNTNATMVSMYELLDDKEYSSFKGGIAFAVGKGISGKTVVTDVAKMPHVLVAGTTGSGKSVCVNTLLMSMLYKYTPDELRLIMIDPKIVELSVYNGIPHLLVPVVTDPGQAAAALHWAVVEMDDRYEKFAALGVRNLEEYNKKLGERMIDVPEGHQPLPKIVVIVDELADLMMVAGKEVEDSICRLLQKARACGIHLVIATQRPSVDVITGLIKANLPSRIAFKVGSMIDSRTILDTGGAEKLLGKGDMLFYPQGFTKPERLQGAFVSDDEVAGVVKFWKDQTDGNVYDDSVNEHMKNVASQTGGTGKAAAATAAESDNGDGRDEYFLDAARFIIEKDKASTSMLQRKFKIGFNRAAGIMDDLADAGIIGDENGTKPREVLISMEKFENMLEMGEI